MRCCKSKYYPQKAYVQSTYFQGPVCNQKQNHDISAESIIAGFMKKSIISSISLLAIILACYPSFPKNEKDILIQANIEALADEEGAVIVCDSGNCGQCFYEVTAWQLSATAAAE